MDELKQTDRQEIHRVMKIEVLETDRFPEIVYASSEVRLEKQKEDLYRASVVGKLSLHGVTSNQEFFSQVALGVDTARAYGNFSLRQSDCNIPIASFAGGTLKLHDELKFSSYVPQATVGSYRKSRRPGTTKNCDSIRRSTIRRSPPSQ